MPVYHSFFTNDDEYETHCGFPSLPLKSDGFWELGEDQDDIVGEVLSSFRANCLFKNFEINSNADRLLMYLTAFTLQLLKKLSRTAKTIKEAKDVVNRYVNDSRIPGPGDKAFPLPAALVKQAKNSSEISACNAYLSKCRKLLANQLLERIYNEDGTQNKWWFQYSKMTFMGIKMKSDGSVF